MDAGRGIYPSCAPSHGCPPDHTHFRLKGKTSPAPPREGGAPFGIPDSTHPTQSCSLSWLHSTRLLVWGGINATLLNVSWRGTAQTKGQECCVMAGAGAGRAPEENNNKATSAEVLQECAPWEEKWGRKDGQFGNLSKRLALPCSSCFQKLEDKM